MTDYFVLRVVTKLLIPFILLFALYVQMHGDYGPGGGFQAGVIFAAGFALYGIVFGLASLRKVIPERVVVFLVAIGLTIYTGVGVATMLLGGKFLDYARLDPHDPAHGHHYGILAIELGVGITVAGVMMAAFVAFAGRAEAKEQQDDAEPAGEPGETEA